MLKMLLKEALLFVYMADIFLTNSDTFQKSHPKNLWCETEGIVQPAMLCP